MEKRAEVADRIASAVVERTLAEGDPWQIHAACGDTPELMGATRPPLVWEALAKCAHCPVVDQCKAWADDESDYVGVAGKRVYTERKRGKELTRRPPTARRAG